MYFMGPVGVEAALPRNGHLRDEYPIYWDDHIEGRIEQHWISNKSASCSIEDPKEMSDFVSCLLLILSDMTGF
jgi:hypothetical protein